MSISIFKRAYPVRHHAAQSIIDGYAVSSYSDTTTMLNVQPLSPDELQALPEGERTVKRVKTFGPDKLQSANEADATPGDRLYYNDEWYECKSSVMWDHTILAHYRSEFVVLPPGEQPGKPQSG